MEVHQKDQPHIPNGGWGWVIVAAVAYINMFNQSLVSTFGLLFGEHLQSMNEETTGAALVTNLNSVFCSFSGLFIGPAIKNSSPRKVAFAGCLFTSIGLLICALSTKLWHVILGYSAFVGIGLGLIAPSSFMAINCYFTTRRGRAVGISLAGTGVGQMIVPHIVHALLERYDFKTAALIMSGLALNGLIGASLFRPLPQVGRNLKEVKLLIDLKEDDTKNKLSEIEINVRNPEEVSELTPKTPTKKLLAKIFSRVSKSMDLVLLKDPAFWSIIMGMALVYTATINFSMLFPYFLQFSAGISRKDTAFCMSAVAGADILCRLLLPFLTDKLQVPYRVMFLMGSVGMLIGRGVIAELNEFYGIVGMCILYGASKAATIITNNLTISAYCSPEKLAGGLGLNMISKGCMAITIGQLLAWIRDYSQSYPLCMHAQNAVILLVLILWIPELVYRYVKNRPLKETCDPASIP